MARVAKIVLVREFKAADPIGHQTELMANAKRDRPISPNERAGREASTGGGASVAELKDEPSRFQYWPECLNAVE